MKIRILIIAAVLLFAGCAEEKKQEAPVTKQQPQDFNSVMINYTVSGAGKGKILLGKKGAVARFDITKVTGEGSNVESMFFADKYLYFYIMGVSGLQPVKMEVVKDIDYRKSFASFIDAAEYTKHLTPDGKETICGKECEKFVYKPDGSTFSVYNGNYVLKASFEGTVIIATSFKENANIDDNYVRVPPGINFIDISKARQ